MLDSEFEKTLRSVLRDSGGPLDADTDLKDLGLNSIGTIELLMRLEEQYGIELPDNELNGETFATPGSLWNVVESYRAKA
ncbi:phosphopantetheine-binding protein [Streptomyces sp. NPDC052396]|uniref:phosphopantetheine-binding protein n=1 Tax=Streptomyces sp. NPDC052396 TaxID=3365689 RepID=UPI0037D66A15